jgi:hypothetical protein
MKNKGLFNSLFIEELKRNLEPDDSSLGRMATLTQAWSTTNSKSQASIWDTFLKQAVSFLEFVPPNEEVATGLFPLYEDWNYTDCISVLYLIPPGSDIDSTNVGSFYPAKLIAELKDRSLTWGILTDGDLWRLYSVKSARPFEDYIELSLGQTMEQSDKAEYCLFERFFHKESFVLKSIDEQDNSDQKDTAQSVRKCRLDHDREQSEHVLSERVKTPFLEQIDEVLQYVCNGFINDTPKTGEEYSEEERNEIFESAVKLIYRCLFLFYAEARRLLPSDPEKAEIYRQHSIQSLCREAHSFRWGKRSDLDQYDLWKHLKGLINAVNDGDPEYGIMGYNGGLFDDEQERFLGNHQLRNDFLSRALYLLAYVEPIENEFDQEYLIPYEDLEVRHLGELYENILEYTVQLADANRYRRRTKKGVQLLLASQTTKQKGDGEIKQGDIYFGESALARKQSGSYYTPESLVRFLNEKTIIQPLRQVFQEKYEQRFKDFLEQVSKGYDLGTQSGAVQSAIALIERFVKEEVLNFKVCDPAMGSGHFLVDAANQMTGLVISLLERIPFVEGANNEISSDPNNWRRLITRHCIYGVDLNPLAVDLAKLSLWLNCFASDHKLTFLDHHIRCGNSLIGLRSLDQLSSIPERKKDSTRKKDTQKLLFDFDDLSDVLNEASEGISSISQINEDDTDAQKALLEESQKSIAKLRSLSDLYTSYLMDSNIQPHDYKDIFDRQARGIPITNSLNLAIPEILESVDQYKNRHHFFHWPLEFPDIFGPNAIRGFSATVGNPPWDVLQPNTQEFYSVYDPNFREYGKQEAIKVIKQLHVAHANIAQKWKQYESGFSESSKYFKEKEAYNSLQKGKIDLYKAFLERFYAVLKRDGHLGIIVPSGLYTDQGCQPLREQFFYKSRINFLYCFENRWPAVFTAVDGRFKFVLFNTQKGGSTETFKCAFMEHDPERLSLIDSSALKMSLDNVRKFSPNSLSVMEFRTQNEIEIIRKVYKDHLHLGSYSPSFWNVSLTQDFNLTSDSHLFNKVAKGIRLYEGKTFFSFDNEYSEISLWIEEPYVRERFLYKKFKKIIDLGKTPDITDYELYRGAFRRIAASTNERTLISTVLPARTVCPHTVFSIQRVAQGKNGEPYDLINASQTVFVVALLNSFVMDFVIRRKISTGLDMHYIYTLPVQRLGIGDTDDRKFFSTIIARGSRLICTTIDYAELWREVFDSDWKSTNYWYPTLAPIDNYGPVQEQEIRNRLKYENENLTSEWSLHCGVHDRLPDRRDTGNRAQLRAEIDAYVAHLYGLTREDFSYILDTFPVLRRKEEQAFGEFMSKRKCLEEFDRIALILDQK